VTAVTNDVDLVFRSVEPHRVRTLLLDADGVLFPSEQPAFDASVEVVNRLAAALGISRRFDADELRLASTGKNFRTTAVELAHSRGKTLEADELERWVADEKTAVTRHLATTLRPDADVIQALRKLNRRYELAVVSSSALARLDVCFEATALAGLLPPARRFSAEDSLPEPSSKPDPAIYLAAAERLKITPDQGLAIEDSHTGAAAAVAAGFPTLGNVCFAPRTERNGRVTELHRAGVFAVIPSWKSIERLLLAEPHPADCDSAG
jgi:HAD superfamily hydrolase (TIGR01509 family)